MTKATDPHTRYWLIEVSAGHVWLLRHFTGRHVVTLGEYRNPAQASAALRRCLNDCIDEIEHTYEETENA